MSGGAHDFAESASRNGTDSMRELFGIKEVSR